MVTNVTIETGSQEQRGKKEVAASAQQQQLQPGQILANHRTEQIDTQFSESYFSWECLYFKTKVDGEILHSRSTSSNVSPRICTLIKISSASRGYHKRVCFEIQRKSKGKNRSQLRKLSEAQRTKMIENYWKKHQTCYQQQSPAIRGTRGMEYKTQLEERRKQDD